MQQSTLLNFQKLFSGSLKAYGQHVPDSKTFAVGDKHTGKSWTEKQRPTLANYEAHFDGKIGLGICPVDEQGKCHFTVIDIDVYDSTTDYVLNIIAEYKFPIVPFRSKSGGVHLYTFYSAPISAKTAIDNANVLRRLLGLPRNTEIFPKQAALAADKQGSWINLPYFAGKSRRLIIDGGEEESVDAAVTFCMRMAIAENDFIQWRQSLPLFDAPPCLQTLYIRGDVTARNNYLFSLGCFYKAKYADEFEAYLTEANSCLRQPLTDDELEHTILNSLRKHSYGYRCNDVPLSAVCDKMECKKREFSRTSENVSGITFEQLTQYTTDPPYYEWVVNGKTLRFESEAEIIKQDKFIELSMRMLGVLPNKVKANVWTEIVNNAVQNMNVVQVDDTAESERGLMRETIKQFFLSVNVNMMFSDSVSSLRPYYARRVRKMLASPRAILHAISVQLAIKPNTKEVASILKAMGAEKTVRVQDGIGRSCWQIDEVLLFNTEAEHSKWFDVAVLKKTNKDEENNDLLNNVEDIDFVDVDTEDF